MKTATHELATTVQPGAALYGLESHLQGKVVTFGGGYPLWRDGQLIAGRRQRRAGYGYCTGCHGGH
ncbi:cob(I)alamin adenosyltransferase PduO [Klebsiella pneumoniae subsp. rhinoscleromatis]|nr:cob(I)alamin adenosyltransferase PduO [Klebsiella pneumoniae subsp. rhinoscleromatis]